MTKGFPWWMSVENAAAVTRRRRGDVTARENEVEAAVVEWRAESKMERLAALRISNEYYPTGLLNLPCD